MSMDKTPAPGLGRPGAQAILPGATLGVMGGGQLGRMFVHAAQTMGYFTVVLDPDAASPAGRVSHQHIVAAYLDAPGLGQLAETCAAITTEFENVPAPALARLAAYTTVSPAAAAVAIAQDRAQEKAHFVACGVPCAPYAVIETAAQLAAVTDDLLPGILKTARMGYDGKGQVRVASYAAGPEGRALRAGKNAAAGGRMLGHRGARRRRPDGAPADPAQPAPRRHSGRHRGV
jgi:phosphoribosylaminoimidazole carboxylase (NCAIR synthetase)